MTSPGESLLGGTAGGGSSARNATAATFQVSDSSLKSMRTTWQGLAKDINAVNTALKNLSNDGGKSLDAVIAKVSQLRGGSAMGAPVAGSGTLSAGTVSGAGGNGATSSSTLSAIPPATPGATGSGGLSRGTVGGRVGGSLIGAVGTAAMAGGSYLQNHMDQISAGNQFFTQQAQFAPGGYSAAAQSQAQKFLVGGGASGLSGYQSTNDLIGGVTNTLSVLGGTAVGNQSTLRSIGGLSALNPGGGLTGSSMAASALYTPQMNMRLRSLGISPAIGRGGSVTDPQQVYRSILQRVYGGKMPTAAQLNAGTRQGSNLYSTLTQGLGLDQNTFNAVIQYGMASANLGGNAGQVNQALQDASAGKTTALTQRAGLNSIRQSQNTLGQSQTRQTQNIGAAASGGIEKGFNTLASATDLLTSSILKANSALGGVPLAGAGILGAVGNPLDTVKHALGQGGNSASKDLLVKGLLSKLSGASGVLGTAAGVGSKLAGAAAIANSTPVYVVNWPIGFGSGGNPLGNILKGKGGGGAATDIERAAGDGASVLDEGSVGVGATGLGKLGLSAGETATGLGAVAVGAGVGQHYLNKTSFAKKHKTTAKVGNIAATTGKYAAAGGAAGALIPIPGVDIATAGIGAVGGTVVGLGKGLWDAFGGSATATSMAGAGSGKSTPSGTTNIRAQVYPANGPITQHFGHNGHPGTDIGAPLGAPIVASEAGTVSYAGHASGFGNAIVINHGSHSTLYGHMYDNGVLVAAGQKVRAGQAIGKIGSNGNSTGPHLHFELHGGAALWSSQGTNTNPEPYLAGGTQLSSSAAATAASASTNSGSAPSTIAPGASSLGPSVSAFATEASALAGLLSGNAGQGAGMAGSSSTISGTQSNSASTPGGTGSVGSGNAGTALAKPSGTVSTWIKQALGLLHLPYDQYAGALATIIQHESGGNPNAVNRTDSNALAGHPSEGLMQTIPGTFAEYAIPGHGNIFNPVDNIIAGARYAISRYGSLNKVPGIVSMSHGGPYVGYASGADQTREGTYYLHDDEMVLAAPIANKVRSALHGAAMSASPQALSSRMFGGNRGGGGGVVISLSAPITLSGRATMADAKNHVRNITAVMQEDKTLSAMASSGGE